MANAREKELKEILTAIGSAPPECTDCVAYCAEGHISVPCRGDFDCSCRMAHNCKIEARWSICCDCDWSSDCEKYQKLLNATPGTAKGGRGMTVHDAICIADQHKPNAIDDVVKKRWLCTLEGQIRNELSIDGAISSETINDLCVVSPYDKLYPAYLVMRIDLENGELDNYNRDAATFNRLWMAFASVNKPKKEG